MSPAFLYSMCFAFLCLLILDVVNTDLFYRQMNKNDLE